MNPTDFWYKIVDMSKSDTPLFTVGGISFPEKYVIVLVSIFVLLVLTFILFKAFKWVTGADLEKAKPVATPDAAKQGEVNAPQATTNEKPAVSVQTPATPTQPTSPQELLADTSDRKRSLHDFVTPDTIHAEVAKQTLTNDFPYQTLKPDATKIGSDLPVTPGVPQPTIAASAPTPSSPMPTAPQPVTVATPIIETPAPVVLNPTIPPVPKENLQTPETPKTPESVPPMPPIMTDAPPAPPQVAPVVAAPTAVTPQPAAPPITPPVEPPATTQTPTVLPPLPTTEPRATMVVGVADSKEAPVTAKQYNPTDPIIP